LEGFGLGAYAAADAAAAGDEHDFGAESEVGWDVGEDAHMVDLAPWVVGIRAVAARLADTALVESVVVKLEKEKVAVSVVQFATVGQMAVRPCRLQARGKAQLFASMENRFGEELGSGLAWGLEIYLPKGTGRPP
jgi:hypothetical protein